MSTDTNYIELLSPARDIDCGIAAINHGSDAVYIGGPFFSARSNASNSVQDIERLIKYAHLFKAKVYVACNTVLFDDELEQAVELIHQLYDIGVDALIIQDMGLLECDLPPIPLHASTQVDNRTIEKVQFLENVGFQQVVLARELGLQDIRQISENTNVVLESFIHGALCVSYSGQCFMSQVVTGRSANRGTCAQFCRHLYDLTDSEGNILEKDRYLLSMRDLNLSDQLENMMKAGVRSFKIEGRLKSDDYVKNVTAYYRKELDLILEKSTLYNRSTRDIFSYAFTPSLQKSFHRGSTTYFLNSKRNKVIEPLTPKSLGENLGTVVGRQKNWFEINTSKDINNGDGLCYFAENSQLEGIRVNKVSSGKVFVHNQHLPHIGAVIYRNHDTSFLKELKKSNECRSIPLSLHLQQKNNTIVLTATDLDSNSSTVKDETRYELADNQERALTTIKKQLKKCGGSSFSIAEITIDINPLPFIPVSALNKLRRECLSHHADVRLKNYHIDEIAIQPNDTPYFATSLSATDNVTNDKAKQFYKRHGVISFEDGPDTNREVDKLDLMTTRHCIKYQLDLCPFSDCKLKKKISEPLFLTDNTGSYQLSFDCEKCQMKLRLPDKS